MDIQQFLVKTERNRQDSQKAASPKACFTREGQPRQTGLLKHRRHAFNQSPKDKAIKQQTAILLQKQPDSKMDG